MLERAGRFSPARFSFPGPGNKGLSKKLRISSQNQLTARSRYGLCADIGWACSSAGEHYVDIVGVTGSIPVTPTIRSFARPCFDKAFCISTILLGTPREALCGFAKPLRHLPYYEKCVRAVGPDFSSSTCSDKRLGNSFVRKRTIICGVQVYREQLRFWPWRPYFVPSRRPGTHRSTAPA